MAGSVRNPPGRAGYRRRVFVIQLGGDAAPAVPSCPDTCWEERNSCWSGPGDGGEGEGISDPVPMTAEHSHYPPPSLIPPTSLSEHANLQLRFPPSRLIPLRHGSSGEGKLPNHGVKADPPGNATRSPTRSLKHLSPHPILTRRSHNDV